MNEVEKMYRNVLGYVCNMPDVACFHECEKCDSYITFTAEKQLELIKWLCAKTYRNYFKICFDFKCKTWYMECDLYSTANKKDFTEALAQVTQCIWQDLTEEERKQIKEILE